MLTVEYLTVASSQCHSASNERRTLEDHISSRLSQLKRAWPTKGAKQKAHIFKAEIPGVGLAACGHEHMVDAFSDGVLAAAILGPQGQLAVLSLSHLCGGLGGVQVQAAQGVLIIHELPALLVKAPQGKLLQKQTFQIRWHLQEPGQMFRGCQVREMGGVQFEALQGVLVVHGLLALLVKSLQWKLLNKSCMSLQGLFT